MAQSLNIAAPSKDYVRLGGSVVAIEHGCLRTPINAISASNSATYANGVYTLTAVSGDIWNSADSFEFAACPIQGDVTIVARVASFQRGASDPVAAIMLRQTLAPDSPNVLIGLEDEFVYESWRTSTGSSSALAHGPAVQDGYWVKLVRGGSSVTSFYSLNGVDWTQLGAPVTLGGSILYAGLALSGWDNIGVSTAIFDNVTLSTVPDFYFTPWPMNWTSSAAGDTNSYGLGIAGINGFEGNVSFSVTGLPNSASYIVNPMTIAGTAQAILTITVPAGAQPGSYPFMVTAYSGAISHTQTATINIGGSGGSAPPSGWTHSAIGTTNVVNGASYTNGVFTLTAQSGDIWGSSDSFEFVYQPMVGDGTIIARISSLQSGATEPVAAVMFREAITPTSLNMLIGLEGGHIWESWRQISGGLTSGSTGPIAARPYSVKLVRTGNSVAGFYSTNGVDWIQQGSAITITSSLLYVGLALSGYDNTNLATATFDNVTVINGNGVSTPDFALGLPSPPLFVNAGSSISLTGSVTALGGFNNPVSFAFTGLPAGITASFGPPNVTGTGTTTIVLNTAASTATGNYTPVLTATSGLLNHNASISLNVNSTSQLPQVQSVSPSSGSGFSQVFTASATGSAGATNALEILVNSSLNGVNACYLHYDQQSNTIYLRDDINPSWAGSAVVGTAATLSNTQCALNVDASSFTGSGTSLQLVLALTFRRSLFGSQQVYAHIDDGTFSSSWLSMGTWNVTLPPGALPIAWTNSAIGSTNAANGASYASGVFTLTAQSGDIWDASDSFEFGYQPMVGNGTIVARIASRQSASTYALAAVMLREGITPTSLNVLIGLENGKVWQSGRSSSGAQTSGVWGPAATAPYWVKLVRNGTSVTSYYASDGVNWTQLGSPVTVTSTLLYAGLAVSSYDNTNLATATFDNLSIGTVPDFYLVALPAQQTSVATLTIPYTVNVQALNGFTNSVGTFAVSGLPTGATAGFTPSTVTGSGSTIMTVHTIAGTSPGIYSLVTSASSGTLNHNTTASLIVTAGVSPSRPIGSTLNSSNSLSNSLVGLFLMNEGTGTSDLNLANSNPAAFAGTNSPTWNTGDQSVVFGGGSSLNSYINVGADLAFDQLPTSKITVVSKVYVNTLTAGGLFEKDDANAIDSGVLFGWDSSGVLRLTVEKSSSNMRVSTAASAIAAGQWIQVAMTWDGTVGTAAAAHLYVNGVEQTKTSSSNGSGTLGYANATNKPFRIGNASFDPMAGSLNGKMAYLAVYRGRILSTTELNQLDSQLPIH